MTDSATCSALRAVSADPACLTAWSQALAACKRAGRALTVLAPGWDGVRERWSVLRLDGPYLHLEREGVFSHAVRPEHCGGLQLA